MKKYLVGLAALFMFYGLAKAGDLFDTPVGGNANAINADYGGVDIATNSFYVGLTTVPSGNGPQGITYNEFYRSTTTLNGLYAPFRWRIYGAIISTAACGNNDFVGVYVSSGPALQAREITRIYNNVAVSTVATGYGCGGVYVTRWPIRAYGNVFFGVNGGVGANPYNQVNLLYYREQ